LNLSWANTRSLLAFHLDEITPSYTTVPFPVMVSL
jgi:hypothetical protein